MDSGCDAGSFGPCGGVRQAKKLGAGQAVEGGGGKFMNGFRIVGRTGPGGPHVHAEHSSHMHPPGVPAGGGPPAQRTLKTGLQAVWHSIVGAVGLIVGLLPHVLHHVGLLAGTALVAGSGGTALFGALGFVASIPLLVRLYRKFGSWVAPALGLLVFAAMFSLSAFVIGPAISGTASDTTPGPVPSVDHTEHTDH